MITCNLKGGLGNQMFQIAATNALALRNNDKAVFNLDACYTPLQGNPSNKYRDNILSKINNSSEFKGRVVYHEPKFSYDELPYTENLILDGYFQSDKYFNDYKEETIELFHRPENIVKTVKSFIQWWGISDKPITSVHIRRGDYLNNSDFHTPCDIEYYKKAIEKIGDSYFIFISDDIEWVKQNFKDKNYVYSTLEDDIHDLVLMTECDNNIIANSSFSWWGAYLNRHKDKRVLAPKKWFGPKGPQDQQDVIPMDWEIVE